MKLLSLLLLGLPYVLPLDNGLALYPPMGWSSWERFRCNTDCRGDPDNCISENLYKVMADRLLSDNYVGGFGTGFIHVLIGDCWSALSRDANGTLQADPERFPSGIKALADYMHTRQLKLGIYADIGVKTCMGYPGSKMYMEKDAQTFAEWGVDMVRVDACTANKAERDDGYPLFGKYLNQTGRPILYSCSWPAYDVKQGLIPNYREVAKHCNIWRNYHDVEDNWKSVKDIIEFYGDNQGGFLDVNGAGGWTDPDSVILGDFGLSYDQQKVHLGIWSLVSAPLFMSNDLRRMNPAAIKMLQNFWLVQRINADYLRLPAKRLKKMGDVEIWTKRMTPQGRSVAFAFLNLSDQGGPAPVNIQYKDLGLSGFGFNITEVFSQRFMRPQTPKDWVNVTVNPSGIYMAVAWFDP